MMNFTRLFLSQVHQRVRDAGVSKTPMKDAWVHRTGRLFEFHGPEGFYWYGRAEDAFDARAKGWTALLEART